MSSLINDIHAEDVANYLNENRQFFHVFPNLLDELSLPHPKTGKEISLLERQVYQLRDQRDRLQVEIETLKDIAGENGKLLHNVYKLSNALLSADTDQDAIDVIYRVMHDVFEVEFVSLMSWELPRESLKGMNQLGISQQWAETLKSTLTVGRPACGLVENEWQKGLFTTSEKTESVCILPLGEHRVWGVLALGSPIDRFKPDLGTYFLEVMGEMITQRLQRLF
ncbi:DUF484 family protein [Hydrogenovibrio kuenenii]|uniref:DUF484 family protein n=1 Tax=Hydrogenovibrio kuenenii TaxID=63658 RepID=UPI0004657B58|nr:DUF484 family protein [Hydrogenovibrio kuenenii]